MLTERQEAKSRGSTDLWWPAETCEIRNGVVVATSAFSRPYYPVRAPELVREFVGLRDGDEDAVRAFVGRRGKLGYLWQEILRAGLPREPENEPLEWICAHARTVHDLMKLIALLWPTQSAASSGQTASRLTSFVNTIVTARHTPETSTFLGRTYLAFQHALNAWPHSYVVYARDLISGVQEWIPYYGDSSDWTTEEAQLELEAALARGTSQGFDDSHGDLVPPKRLKLTDEEARWLARHIIKDVTNRNLRGVQPKLVLEGAGARPHVSDSYPSLVSAIYRHVADAASGRKEYRYCVYEKCGKLFHVTDQRQIYCPPEIEGTESLCAMKARQAKRYGQIKAKKEAKRGKQ